ncbi:Mycolic acid cyclopropane synthetase [Seminavis robusta]|uniref:Mycolic acid cyclopropane synthetase n=1 Tax=Seminavis robusta TaxID=568900 RepID=A0A9N8E4F7_9STRA|nr:Mycolic acid cyclopropane synthetase [Seminavis robusta]|eukprot:Sro655_g182170.1 Mycolic acid cyclopropane synthetase (212) ;mRNA; f:565-1200
MLAPRKKLHSSPSSVLDLVNEWVSPLLRPGDVVCDIGCGDGRVLLHLAKQLTSGACHMDKISFVGIDINPDRVQEAIQSLSSAKEEGTIHPNVSVVFHCANAMESIDLYKDATFVFLYLIPRGLKIFKPMLYQVLQHQQQQKEKKKLDKNRDNDENVNDNVSDQSVMIRVMTYMAPLPDEKYTRKGSCHVEHQPGAAWPVYFYELCPSMID